MNKEVQARFWSKVKVLKTRQCWEWQSSLSNGYGKISINNYPHSAHVLSYIFFFGEYDKSLWIDHKCRNKKCVNPKHMRAVSPRINAIENSESTSAKNYNKTHCKYGHEFSLENTAYRFNHGHFVRKCKKCANDYRIKIVSGKTARQALKEIEG